MSREPSVSFIHKVEKDTICYGSGFYCPALRAGVAYALMQSRISLSRPTM